MVKECKALVRHLKDKNGEPISAKAVYVSVTLKIIIGVAFGGNFDADWMEEIWTKLLRLTPTKMALSGLFGKTLSNYLPYGYSFDKLKTQIIEKSIEHLKRRRNEPADKKQIKSDIVGTMLEDTISTDTEVIDEGIWNFYQKS
jgi:hypothetical protein